MVCVLVSCLTDTCLATHQVAVEHRESYKEADTDQVLNCLNVLVEIHHGVD